MPRWVVVAPSPAGEVDDATVEGVLAGLDGGAVVVRPPRDELDDVLRTHPTADLVVVGGDGSVHHLAGALERLRMLDRPVAIVPAGTGDDLATHLGITEDLDVSTITSATPRPLDLLRVTDDEGSCVPVINAVHFGVGAEAADRGEELKDRLGPLAYPLGAARALGEVVPWSCHVEVDGAALHDGPALLVGVANGPTIGGGAPLAPDADPSDGVLDVVVGAPAPTVARMAADLRDAISDVRPDPPRVTRGRGSRMALTAERPVPADVDGELVGASRSWHVEVAPAAWSVRVPS